MEPKSEEEIPPKEETAVPSASADNSDEQPPGKATTCQLLPLRTAII